MSDKAFSEQICHDFIGPQARILVGRDRGRGGDGLIERTVPMLGTALGVMLVSVLGASAFLPSVVAASLFWTHVGAAAVSVIAIGSPSVRPTIFPFLVVVLYLVPGVIVAQDLDLAFVGWTNTALGVVAGSTLGWMLAYGREAARISSVLAAVIVALSVLILLDWFVYRTTSGHEFKLAWGRSNYVSAVLVVGGLLSSSQMMRFGRTKSGLAVLGISSFASLLVLSRGSTLALIVGLGVIGVGSIRSAWLRLVAVVFLAPVMLNASLAVLERVSLERGLASTDARSQNVEIRFELWKSSFQSFRDNPIVGSGFGGLRSMSVTPAGLQFSHAHNFVLSFIQQAGLFALPFLTLMIAVWVSGFRRGSIFERAALCSLLVIALVEPFFEGLVGAIVATALLVVSARHRSSCQLGNAATAVLAEHQMNRSEEAGS